MVVDNISKPSSIKQNQKDEHQLKMAGMLQRDFLPKKLPQLEGIDFATVYIPADCVSGDIYDISRLDEEHIGFYIADAVGHSMPAALMTIFIKQAIEMRETLGNSYRIFKPDEVLNILNKKMVAQGFTGCLFATAVYCLLNIKTMQLSYARAGHPYPLVIRSNNEIVSCESRGSLLGVFENSHFTTQTINLNKGDKLFLYSDGAEEIIAHFDDGEEMELSEEFLSSCTYNAPQMCEYLENVANEKVEDLQQIDDITAISLEITK